MEPNMNTVNEHNHPPSQYLPSKDKGRTCRSPTGAAGMKGRFISDGHRNRRVRFR